MRPLKVDNIGNEDVTQGDVQSDRDLVAVIAVAWETEAVIEQQELVGAVAVAIKNLITCLECLSVLVHKCKVSVISHCLGDKPIELLIGLLAV